MTCEAITVNHLRSTGRIKLMVKHTCQMPKRRQAALQNPWPATLGGVIAGLQGPSLLGLAGSCDSRGVRLQDVLFPAYCSSQSRIREAEPDGLWTVVGFFFFPLATKLKLPRDLSTLLLISMWAVQWNPCTQHRLYLPGCCLECGWAQMENIESCCSQHTELISKSNEGISSTLWDK